MNDMEEIYTELKNKALTFLKEMNISGDTLVEMDIPEENNIAGGKLLLHILLQEFHKAMLSWEELLEKKQQLAMENRKYNAIRITME